MKKNVLTPQTCLTTYLSREKNQTKCQILQYKPR